MIKEDRLNDAHCVLSKLAQSVASIELGDSFSTSIDMIINCVAFGGKIVTTGMGKAGIAMQKFSAILRSLSFPSAYIHPGESSHGDLGLLTPQDILFVASTSGKTREVIETIVAAKAMGVTDIICLTSHKDSPIRSQSTLTIDMGEIKEAGYLHIAPTSSILVMMAITDTLALTCAKEREVTFEDYAKRHHSGYLGQLAKSKSTSSSFESKFEAKNELL
jgi:arabinose-5-phosphate isomerase